jgi:hypothetical protein
MATSERIHTKTPALYTRESRRVPVPVQGGQVPTRGGRLCVCFFLHRPPRSRPLLGHCGRPFVDFLGCPAILSAEGEPCRSKPSNGAPGGLTVGIRRGHDPVCPPWPSVAR